MQIVITGATGFIGRALCEALHRDYEIVALSRDGSKAGRVLGKLAGATEWDGRTASTWAQYVEGAAAIINLAGENVGSGKWTGSKRRSIRQSRLSAAKAILDAVTQAKNKPKVVIQASAIGYYGSRADEDLDEESQGGRGFLAEVCQKTESVAQRIAPAGSRCVIIRTGLVLGSAGGVLPSLIKPFRFFLGGYVGSGKQWVSWISINDVVSAIRYLMENDKATGVYNLTSPEPVTMKQFCKTLGKAIKRPCWTVLPEFAARLVLGAKAEETVLSSQKVTPRRLREIGFAFEHPTLQTALAATIEDTDDEFE